MHRVYIFSLRIFSKKAFKVKARHELLEAAIGVFPEEDQAYLLVTTLSWIFPLVIIVASVVDMLLVIIYMRFAHPWKGILFLEEVIENEQEEAKKGARKGGVRTTVALAAQGEP